MLIHLYADMKSREPIRKVVEPSTLKLDFIPMKPKFEIPLQNIVQPLGTPITLECVARGRPRPDVVWFHNGQKVDLT